MAKNNIRLGSATNENALFKKNMYIYIYIYIYIIFLNSKKIKTVWIKITTFFK